MRRFAAFLVVVSVLGPAAVGQEVGRYQEPIPLIDANQTAGGWRFDNGREFPGAQGSLELAAEPFRGKPVLSLHGDFTQGGNYVQAWIALPKEKVDTLSFWVNSPVGSKRLPIRYIDANDRVHQLNLRLNEKGGWQHLVLPLDEFFKRMGTSSALDIVTGYEAWDGAKDRQQHQKDHQPSPNLAILASRAMETTKGTVLISDVLFHPCAEAAAINTVIRLDKMLQHGEIDWDFNLGQEFAGAKGGLDLVPLPVGDSPDGGVEDGNSLVLPERPEGGLAEIGPIPFFYAMRLHADFTGGGAYVGVRKSFAHLNVQAMNVIRLRMRSTTTKSYAIRLVDGTGQCHQRKDQPFNADGQWHDVEIVPTVIAGGEHWGGANDGKWHDSVQLIELMLNVQSHDGKRPDLTITDMRADVTVAAGIKAAAFTERFESDEPLAQRWQTSGSVQIDQQGHAESAKSLVLKRTLDTLQTDTHTTGPAFAVNPGAWQVQYAWKSQLHSPDNSYHGSVVLEVLDRGGRLQETIPVGIGFGSQDWQTVSVPATLPNGASQARFRVQLNKTYGSFWLDDLSASPLSIQPIAPRVERVLLATDAVGNLFFPGDPVRFRVTVEAVEPLDPAQQVVRYSVRDYWGAEQFSPGEVALEKAPRKENRFVYSAVLDIPDDALAVGKFYELHVEIPQEAGDPVREYSGLAVLPLAPAKQYAPEQVPFTIRNWDSRVPVYFRLADRLGLRLLGVWGGWSPKEPYKPHCPGIELCQELGAKWITGTPASSVERQGFAEYSEEALRGGMANFLQQYAGRGMAMIAMGNEPHGTGQKVLDNVRAYRAIYETVKAFDPNIHVIGTSVEPNEEYFRAGYQNYLDSYDFHIYEHYSNVRRTIREYRALMDKYNAVKPIHSTELGLNSQGQTRLAVAVEMIKKFTVFFAEGGSTVSWFTIQYPDPAGKARGQFGDAHCVFDCKYNLYNPRLDAITHYHLLNGICDKKFIEERQYAGGVQAFLFRNASGDCLQVLWLDDARQDHSVPLPADQDIQVVRIDGSSSMLRSTGGGITLTLSAEPVLLLYRDEKQGIAPTLEPPALSLVAAPVATSEAEVKFLLQGQHLSADSLRVACPPLWSATWKPASAGQVECTIRGPGATAAREVRIFVQRLSAGKVVAELTVGWNPSMPPSTTAGKAG
ncbi:MAG: hypothetical protein KJ000_07430 [Pirellulaceae bacterium]|nr:hypothetical protein [Pirellulaceae bacterium]